MQVFHDHQHRLPPRLRREPGQQGLQGLLALPLGRQGQRRDSALAAAASSKAASRGTASGSATPDAVSAASNVRSFSWWRLVVLATEQALQMRR